jgi:hypothetical protein
MGADGRSSDFRRLQGDLRTMNGWHLTREDLTEDDEIDMVVTLRMNREFMEHMRLHYSEVIKSTHPLFITIVSAQDIFDQNTTNNVDDEDLY